MLPIQPAQLQTVPTPQLFFSALFGPELVSPGSEYDLAGEFTVPVVIGATYVWVGSGAGEQAFNNGVPVASNVPFVATATPLLLTGDAETEVLASVRRQLRPA